MSNENAVLNEQDLQNENISESFDFDELEEKIQGLQEQFEEEFADLEFLQEEGKKINSPDVLGETIKNVIWDQFLNQIATTAGEDFIKDNREVLNQGKKVDKRAPISDVDFEKYRLDLSNQAHIQTSENFAEGKIATHNYISKEQLKENYERFTNTPHGVFRDKYVDPGMNATLPRAGVLRNQGIDTVTDIYTGKQIPTQTRLENGKNNPEAAQREHVKSSSELYKNPSLQMANNNEDLAGIINNPENLQGYTTAERNQRKNDKSAAEMDESDKTKHWKKADEKAEEFVKQKEKEGEDRLMQEGRKTQKEEALRIGNKALRAVAMQLLADLVIEIIGKLVRWLKSAQKNIETFFASVKEAIRSFIGKLKNHVFNAGNTIFNTVVTALSNEVLDTIKRALMFIKQGWRTMKEAIAWIRSPKNKGKSIGILMLEVGKIIMAGLSAAGAIVLSEAIEKSLMAIPGAGAFFAFEIPQVGSLANILGIFFGAVVAGIIGAIVINLLQKRIERIKETKNVEDQIDKGNKVLNLQQQIKAVNEASLNHIKEKNEVTIKERHKAAANMIQGSLENIAENCREDDSIKETQNEIDSLFAELEDMKL